MTSRKKPSGLIVKLATSHALVTGAVGLLAALTMMGLFYLIEDRVYESVVQATLQNATKPVQVWAEGDAPPEIKALTHGRTDGVWEADPDGRELHLGLSTLSNGERRVAALESGEVSPGRALPLIVAASMAGLALLAAGVGAGMARRILSPLEVLSSKIGEDAPTPSSTELRSIAGDDEVGRVARQLARYLEEREAALAREAEFLRDASHELRNPLSVLHGAVATLRETGLADEGALTLRLDRMERSITRMRRTVEGLLTLARQESAALAEAGASLEESVEELIEDSRLQAKAGVQVHLELEGLPPGPPELWIVILRNLLDNALAHTDVVP
jgi:signal transduction histidine kinase